MSVGDLKKMQFIIGKIIKQKIEMMRVQEAKNAEMGSPAVSPSASVRSDASK
jgi:hypothetical protein